MNYICSTCGQSHEGVPLSFAADYPDQFANMSPDDRQNRAIIGSDQCIIDSEVFFIRGCLEIPIREKLHGPFKGILANQLREYPNSLNLKLTVKIQPVGQRPLFFLDEREHSLSIAQERGIGLEEVHKLVSMLMHRTE